MSVFAIGNGETTRTDQALFDTTNPAALGTAGPGTALVAARRDHIHTAPASLSGDSDPIILGVAAIHTTGATDLDEIWIWAHNTDGTDRKLTIEFGGVAAKDTIELTIPAESGLVPVVQGIPMNGSAVVTAFAASASVIGIVGFVNRITA